MTMDEILDLERKCRQQVFEAQMQTARLEATTKAINDVFQTMFALHNMQILGLMSAGLNPNFCKPKEAL